ncbi:MAG: hypothetical protein JST30_13510 [Armatimonadetes bacterium]|nr:hypothetical protein [Armatimonadota bacterium]
MRIVSDEDLMKICDRIAGGESLRSICCGKGVPDKATFLRRVAADANLRAAYVTSLRTRAEGYAEEIISIADDPDLSVDEKRVRIDSRKWLASKLQPKTYGERFHLERETVQVKAYVLFDPAKELFADGRAEPLALPPGEGGLSA